MLHCVAPSGEESSVQQVMSALDPGASQKSWLEAAISQSKYLSPERRYVRYQEALVRSFQAVTSGRADADELRAAFALGGWVAVRDLLEAQGAVHARTDSP